MIKVIKKSGIKENWREEKIRGAILLANKRTNEELTQEKLEELAHRVTLRVPNETVEIPVNEVHNLVMDTLREDIDFQQTFQQYAAYRNYKKIFSNSFIEGYEESTKILFDGDKENANKDSELNSTKQSLISSGIMRQYMTRFVLRKEWVEAHKKGFIHIHDLAERFLNGHNCNLFRMGNVLKGGFELNGIMYSEPSGVQKAFDVAGDIVLSASAQQYGGFTVSYVDELFGYYAEKTYQGSLKHYLNEGCDEKLAKKLAMQQTLREIEQGYQGFETKLNTVSNALGQTPFVTITLGLKTGKWEREISKVILETRSKGLGQKKTTAVFPKIVYLYRTEISGEGAINEDIFDLAIECSRKRMYPDYLSGDEGFQCEIYDECGRMISPMG